MITTFVGVATADITPSYPVMLGGFGQRITPSESVHDAIETVALCIGEDEPMLVITADLIAMAAPVTKEVVAEIHLATGIDSNRILLAASHTHSAPVPYDLSGSAIGVQQFSQQLTDALIKAGIEAFHSRRPARLVSGYGNARIGFNRWKPNDVQEVDTRIPVLLAIDSQTDSPFAVLFGSGCHPTTMGWDNPEVSADYPGEAKRFIRKALPGVTPLFINTTEGEQAIARRTLWQVSRDVEVLVNAVSHVHRFFDGLHSNCNFGNSWNRECSRHCTSSHNHVIVFAIEWGKARNLDCHLFVGVRNVSDSSGDNLGAL